MRLEDIADKGLIDWSAAADREQAIERLSSLLYRNGNIEDLTAFRQAVYAREAELSCELTPTVSVPHAKSKTVIKPAVAAMRTADNHTVFLIASNDDNGHIAALSRISRALLEEES